MGKKNNPLTNRQAELLRFLYQFRAENGESPTLATTVTALGLASNRSAIDMMRSLINRGYLEPTPKVSRSTQLTTKAMAELKLRERPTALPTAPQLFLGQSFSTPSTQATGAAPPPTWALLPEQQKGTQSGSASDDIQRLLRNAASMLINAGTTSGSHPEPRFLTHPLVFFTACCIAIFVIFGTGVEAGILYVLVVLIITLRSIR